MDDDDELKTLSLMLTQLPTKWFVLHCIKDVHMCKYMKVYLEKRFKFFLKNSSFTIFVKAAKVT